MMWFIVGGLVVAVTVVAYFMMSGGVPATEATAPAGGDVSVNVETAPAPADEATPDAAPAETTSEPAPPPE